MIDDDFLGGLVGVDDEHVFVSVEAYHLGAVMDRVLAGGGWLHEVLALVSEVHYGVEQFTELNQKGTMWIIFLR